MKRERAAIYCRLSEEDKGKGSAENDSNSIQNQRALLTEYAHSHGWEIYEIYIDDDYSGADRSRPAFKRMLHAAEEKRFDIILCKTQSRFSRELEVVERYINRLLPQWGIRFLSLVDNADSANEDNLLLRQINGIMDEHYLAELSKNIRSVLTHRRKSGFHIGSFALYGYKKNPDRRGHLLIDEEAAAVVREVFTLFSQGYGKTSIARMLNERGIPNPTEYKRLQGIRYRQPKGKGSTLWKYFAISNMLTNEIYIGNMVQGKYGSISYKTKQNKPRPKEEWIRTEGTHEPIIEQELWERVQKMLAERAKPFPSGTIGLFARKARCAECGYTLRSSKTKGKYYLQCPNHHISKESCRGAFISVERLERMVLQELHTISDAYLNWDELERQLDFCSHLKEQRASLQKSIHTHEKKIEEAHKAVRELYPDKVRGVLSEAEYLDLSKHFSAELQQQERLIADAERKIIDLDARIAAGDNRRAIIEKYINPTHLTREMVEILIDSISVGRRIAGTREVPITIYWRF